MAELLEALDTLHGLGFVHRDVKPDNMVLDSSGHLKLLDFGLCTDLLGGQGLERRETKSDAEDARILHRSCVGTLQYLAPDVLLGEYSKEVDIWSFGIIVFECLAGFPMFLLPPESDQQDSHWKLVTDKIMRYREVVPEMLDMARHFGHFPPSAE